MFNTVDTTHGGLTNDLSDWFPIVAATGVRVPKTTIGPVPESLIYALLDDQPMTTEDNAAVDAVHEAATAFGYPVFMRTGELSAKHSWDYSCFLTSKEGIKNSIAALFETQMMAFLPMPKNLIVREMLPTTPVFYAFGGTPITQERRYFVDNGKVYDHHPYWPLMSIDGHEPRTKEGIELPEGEWQSMLKGISQNTDHEELVALTEKAAAGLTGAWSMDWLRVGDEWVFIDAAHAESSYVMPEEDRLALSS